LAFDVRSFANGVPALVFALHECAELAGRRSLNNNSHGFQPRFNVILGKDLIDNLVQLDASINAAPRPI